MADTTSNTRARDFVVLLSLSNLLFLVVWRELVFASTADAYWLPSYARETYLAIFLNVIGVAALAWCGALLVRKTESRFLDVAARLIFLALLIFPLQFLRKVADIDVALFQWARDYKLVSIPITLALAAILGWLLIFRLFTVARVTAVVLLILSPFAAITLSQAGWKAITVPAAKDTLLLSKAGASEAEIRASRGPRIVWLMFDELDHRLAFTDPPDRVDLPAFRKFAGMALFGMNPNSHSMSTVNAVPSYLLGRLVLAAEAGSQDELLVRFDGDPEGQFQPQDLSQTIFRRMSDLGDRIALVGYYHPYCRLFDSLTDYCRSFTFATFTAEASGSVMSEMAKQLIAITPVAGRLTSISTFEQSMADTVAAAADESYDFVYAHASVPHPPNIYDQNTGKLTLWNTARDGYLDNLVLADRYMGAVRDAMSASGVWDDAAVLITSDHEWRYPENYDGFRTRKVPFILKMPGQTKRLTYSTVFSPMLVIKDLLQAIREEHVKTPEDVAAWLDKRATVTVGGRP